MEMVYCRGCAKQIHHSALACVQCGAQQAAPTGQAGQRNIIKLIAVGFLWSLILWFVALFVVGAIAGVMDPANAQANGERLGQMLSGPVLLGAICLSVALTVYGKLPGTAKPGGTAAS